MKKQFLNKRCLPALLGMSLLFLSGCNIGDFLNRARIGFSEQAGVFAFDLLAGFLDLDEAGDLELIPVGTMDS